ncbi:MULTISPECIES: acyltransferase family protein [Paraburkholderia]|uniref:Peptidoglycan/LPS O-acetylase OafA/YrhL, contains acyltransferase and SGNH-hydrolase domains n=1 Tax=Paraburkholderia phenazinium TaxID=60549 RepID=A0A1N6KIL2_9BURK|nr:acyltransferase [Paraburkholderia phenazinium]SIO56176.1 Peptidoglycan/LPS O-acetylase OafA/YrhL, contains acyltransferase and SGNH-hydrolase domains [Paraburkholderia phenazinium]
MKTNYAELHSLRGIAALIVVSTHFLIILPQFYSGVTLHSGWLSVLLKYTPFHFLLGGHGSVVLFFALSGFVLAQAFLGGKKVSYGTYLIRRVLRIMPAYWIAILAACALASIVPGYSDARLSDWYRGVANQPLPTLDVVLGHLLLIGQFDTERVNPVVWSLVHEMRISIIFPFLAMFAARRPPKFVLLVTALAVPLSIALQFLSASFGATLEYVPVFMFGILLAMHLPACSAWFLAKSGLFRIGSAVAAFLLIYYVRTNEATPMWISSILEYFQGAAATLLMLVAISSARTGRVLKHSVARFFGDISYSLYLWHVPVLIATIKLLGASSLPLAVVMLIGLSLAVLVSLLSFRLIERPFMALGKALTSKRSKLVVSST